MFLILAALCVLPRILITLIPADAQHSGITTGGIALYTYSIPLLLCFVFFGPITLFKAIPRTYVALLIVLTLLTAFYWEPALERWAGLLHVATAVVAWGVGATLSRVLNQDLKGDRVVVLAVALVVAAEAAFSVLQIIGVRDIGTLVDGGERIARISGSLGHPGTLGKTLFFLMILLLPFTRSIDRVAKRLAVSSIVLIVVLTALTYGRANILAAFAVIVGWSLFAPGRNIRARFALPVGAALMALPFLGPLLLRFEADPDGGDRPYLLPAAYEQISRTPIFGIGPNSYISTVSQFDPFTTFGLPVHNSFLLALAEFGALGAILLLIPLIWLIIGAVRRMRVLGSVGDSSVALLASLPGILLTGLTGWGLMASATLPLWFFVYGFLSERILNGKAEEVRVAGLAHNAKNGTKTEVFRNTAVAGRREANELP
jgi:hypothetical protein